VFQGKTIYKQDTFDAYITGDIMDLPAGPLATAIGVSYQTDEIQDTPGEQTLQGNSWGMTSAGITAGSSSTKAAYAELRVPIFRNARFADFLDITASTRYTDVSTYGDDITYKISGNWGINENWRLRASRGTSFRAPALFELFLQEQTSFFNQRSDPCWNWGARQDDGSINPTVAQNCQADGVPRDYANDFGSGTAVTSGGAGVLEAETSTSEGVGVVFTSTEGNLAASLDYYEVEILQQVSNVGGSQILNLCYTSEDFENEPFCDMFTRRDGEGGDWGIDQVFGGYVNVARQFVRGVDFVATYTDETPIGMVRIRLDHTAQIERSFKQFPDSEELQYVGRLGNPKHSGTLNTTLYRDDWSFNWAIRYAGSVSNHHLYDRGDITTYRGEDVRFVAKAGFTHYHSFSVSREFDSGADLTIGVANAFDRKPPRMSPAAATTVGNAALYSQYDNFGRRLFVNFGYRF